MNDQLDRLKSEIEKQGRCVVFFEGGLLQSYGFGEGYSLIDFLLRNIFKTGDHPVFQEILRGLLAKDISYRDEKEKEIERLREELNALKGEEIIEGQGKGS